MRVLLVVSVSFALALSTVAFMPPMRAAAAAGTYWFHGQPTDQGDKANGLATASFNSTPPAGMVPVTQTTTGLSNQDYAANPLTLYWHAPYPAGTLTGQLAFDWWWTAPAATTVSVTAFADPDYAANTGKIIGRGVVQLAQAATPTEMHGSIFVNGTIQSELLIQVAATSLITGNGIEVLYDSTTTPSNFTFVAGPLPVTPTVSFDTTTPFAFAPSTTVSASFFGAEPQTTLERPVAGSLAGRIDPNRIFIDWPLSSRTGIGQLSRSLDGGDSFRLLYDRTCAERSRPNCLTEGGGDTEDEVNLINGDLLFADQEVVANQALASSTDHGDTFPALRQFAVSNTGTAVDRQWLAWSDPSLVSVAGQPIEAFFSYHVPALAVHVMAITTAGTPIVQPVPQLLDVSQSGNLRVDNTTGPGRGWIYLPYRNGGGYQVASVRATAYADQSAWKANLVSSDQPAIFPWLNLDAHGNAYAVWVANGIVYLSVSPIDDSRNNPATGRPATYWTPQIRVTPSQVTSAVFPEVTGGDAGRIAIAYMGSEDCVGVSDGCANAAHWNTYVSVLTDALSITRGGPTTILAGKVNHRIDHRGQVCTSGTTCSGDRSLLDMMDLGYDQTGRIGMVFMDNNNGLAAEPRTTVAKAGPFTQFAKEVAGPSLLAPTRKTPSSISVSIPQNGRTDPAGDATWPNVAGAANLASLDLLGASVSVSGTDLVARIPLSDATRAGMARDLSAYNAVIQSTPKADRLQYVFRFSTAEDVFHLSMEYNSDGTVRFFGGKLDANDALSNGSSTLGAVYNTDASYPVSGTLDGGALTLRAPLSAFGLAVGSSITGAAAYSMAGPAESLDGTIVLPTRTVDATPPFDATLAAQPVTTGLIDCTDPNVQTAGGWHVLKDPQAGDGTLCRDVGTNKTGDTMKLQFAGTGIDIVLANGPRGGILGFSVDGVKQEINEYAISTSGSIDQSGKKGLTYNVVVHRDVASGTHNVVITNDSTDNHRDMVYVDGFKVYGGDVGTPAGHFVQETEGLVLSTALAGVDTVNAFAVEPATTLIDVVMETVAGTTVSIKDPAGKTLATATVDDGGVLDLQALPDGAGAYALVVHDGTAGTIAFQAWEVLTEAR
ncbi:MAG TPA: hypothetical protein VF001_09310 [Candidatus Limnocylindria bacterium]